MSHRPLYHNTTVVICVNVIAKYASVSADIERKKKKTSYITATIGFFTTYPIQIQTEESGPSQFA